MRYTTATIKHSVRTKNVLADRRNSKLSDDQFKAENEFQVWKLTAKMERKITCEDGNDNILKTQIIPFTDFKDTEVIF
jgi:hypothetical protein